MKLQVIKPSTLVCANPWPESPQALSGLILTLPVQWLIGVQTAGVDNEKQK